MASDKILDLEDQRLLNLTLTHRERIISQLTMGNKIPNDKDEIKLLISSLDGIDRTVIGRAKVKNDENANKNQENSASLIAELLLRTKRDTYQNTIPLDMSPINDLPECLPLLGQTDIGVINIDPSTFID